MAKLFNLARMSTTTTGTGTITLGSAVSGYLTFAQAGVANGDSVDYAIKDGSNSEHGTGTYTSAGTTLTRSVTKSTNSNNPISLSGTAEVFISPRAETLNDASVITTGTMATARLGSGTADSTTLLAGDQTYAKRGRVLLTTLTASASASLDYTSFSSDYDDYELVFDGLVPATNSVSAQLEVHSGGAFQTSSYLSTVWVYTSSGGAAQTATAYMNCSVSGAVLNSGAGLSGTFRVHGPVSGTSKNKVWNGMFAHLNASSAQVGGQLSAQWNNTAALTGFRLRFSSGNITSGTIKVYGLS